MFFTLICCMFFIQYIRLKSENNRAKGLSMLIKRALQYGQIIRYKLYIIFEKYKQTIKKAIIFMIVLLTALITIFAVATFIINTITIPMLTMAIPMLTMAIPILIIGIRIGTGILYMFKPHHYFITQWKTARAKTTFLLCIRPKSNLLSFFRLTKKKPIAENFPPPGYGIPLGYKHLVKAHNYQPKNEYGLYLYPGRINLAMIFLSFWLSFLVCAPFINEYEHDHPTYPLMIFFYLLLAWLGYSFLFKKMMPASLTNVWEKWPIPAYELFLSVPHKVTISPNDCLTEVNTKKRKLSLLERYQVPKEYIFWRPDKKTPMWRQSTENSPDMHTLQDLILNLAVFEFLFHKNNPQAKKIDSYQENETNQKTPIDRIKLKPSEESLREYHWYFFLFSPIIINLVLILLGIFLFSFLSGFAIEGDAATVPSEIGKIIPLLEESGNKITRFTLITNFPYNFVIAVLSWFLFTIYYVHWILSTLTDLSQKIRQGYFNAQLDLIPQQILNELSYIPTQQQVDRGISYVKNILSWSSGIVFLGLMAVLEIFSQTSPRIDVNYYLWEKLMELLPLN